MITISWIHILIGISVVLLIWALTRPSSGGYINLPSWWTIFIPFGLLIFWMAWLLKSCVN